MGLGRILLRHTMNHLASLGLDAITLTVTEGNEPAVRLYREMGFSTRQRFEAMVLERS
jgi:ribosomal protein S18 acetylase RimI-like enzyme